MQRHSSPVQEFLKELACAEGCVDFLSDRPKVRSVFVIAELSQVVFGTYYHHVGTDCGFHNRSHQRKR
jgi:hypothetical protein